MKAPPSRQQRQQFRATKKQKKSKKDNPQSIWHINENSGSYDKKDEVLALYDRSKSVINDMVSDESMRRIDTAQKRKSVFDDSSSSDDEDDDDGRRLTVDVTNARNHSVSGHVNLRQGM